LGGGGFGKTYLAEDIDRLNTKCVIKQFAPQIQGAGALEKATALFQQEAKQLEQLGTHPQIPGLWAYFEEHSRLYLELKGPTPDKTSPIVRHRTWIKPCGVRFSKLTHYPSTNSSGKLNYSAADSNNFTVA
jgi:serine/threonine protein kinase